MNCYEWMDRAKSYAVSILDGYINLLYLEIQSLKDTKEYQEKFEELKTMIECERQFYSLMDICELEFIQERLMVYDNVPKPYSTLDIFILGIREIDMDKLEWDRVNKQIAWFKDRKDYPALSCETKQVGMVPLLPYIAPEGYLHCISKIAITKGCYQMNFSQNIFQSASYSLSQKIFFKYLSSFADINIENYYLQTQFAISKENIDKLLKIFDNICLNNIRKIESYCFDFFKLSFFPYVHDIAQFDIEDLDKNPLGSFIISATRDAVYSYLDVIPYNSMKKSYDDILKIEGNASIKDYFVEKLEPLVIEKTKKVMVLDKKVKS